MCFWEEGERGDAEVELHVGKREMKFRYFVDEERSKAVYWSAASGKGKFSNQTEKLTCLSKQRVPEDVSVRKTYWCIQRIRSFTMMRYVNRLFTYLVTFGTQAPSPGRLPTLRTPRYASGRQSAVGSHRISRHCQTGATDDPLVWTAYYSCKNSSVTSK